MLRPNGVLLLTDLVSGESVPERTLVSSDGAVRWLASRVWTEAAAAAAGFQVRGCIDCREEFLEMVGQMIFDDACECIGPEAFAALRRKQAGYRMWILERGEGK